MRIKIVFETVKSGILLKVITKRSNRKEHIYILITNMDC